MKILLSKPRGFCAGVVRAIQIVERALELYGPPIFVKHEIVHNRHVVEELRQKGAIFIEDLNEVPEGSRLIYSAHGVSPAVRQQALERGLIEIDATCGLVTKVHSAAKRYADKGYHILLIGHRNHVEIIGTAGEAPDVTTIIESVGDVEKLQFPQEQKLFYLTQTTLSLDDVEEIANTLKEKYPHIETLPSSSICYATTNRQMAFAGNHKRVRPGPRRRRPEKFQLQSSSGSGHDEKRRFLSHQQRRGDRSSLAKGCGNNRDDRRSLDAGIDRTALHPAITNFGSK